MRVSLQYACVLWQSFLILKFIELLPWLQYVPFWVIPRRLSFNSRRFGTPYRFHLHRQVDEECQ
jgi:hypothetical protein